MLNLQFFETWEADCRFNWIKRINQKPLPVNYPNVIWKKKKQQRSQWLYFLPLLMTQLDVIRRLLWEVTKTCSKVSRKLPFGNHRHTTVNDSFLIAETTRRKLSCLFHCSSSSIIENRYTCCRRLNNFSILCRIVWEACGPSMA